MESAAAPASSSSRANRSGLKSDRINPRDGEAFFNSAMMGTESWIFSSSTLRKPRGTCSAARRSSSRKSAASRVSASLRRVAATIWSRLAGMAMLKLYGNEPTGRESRASRVWNFAPSVGVPGKTSATTNATAVEQLGSHVPIIDHQFAGPGWLPYRSLWREPCHIGFDIEHRRAVDCIKALHFDCQALNREQAAHRDPNPVGPVLPALSENAHFRPVRTPPRPARAKIDLGIWYAVERENNLHMGEFFQAFQAIGSKSG